MSCNIGYFLCQTTTFFFYLNASTLVNTDTVRPGGDEKTLRSSRLSPPRSSRLDKCTCVDVKKIDKCACVDVKKIKLLLLLLKSAK